MNQMIALFRILTFGFLIFFFGSISFADDLTFSQAWSLLQKNNGGLASAYTNQEKSLHMVEAAEDLYWPKIGISADYTKLDDEVSLSPSDLLCALLSDDRLNGLNVVQMDPSVWKVNVLKCQMSIDGLRKQRHTGAESKPQQQHLSFNETPPYLKKLMNDYAATGLSQGYIPSSGL